MFSFNQLTIRAGLVNFVVLTAICASATNSGIYSNSRILFGLAKQGLGPKVLSKTNGSSVPYLSMLVSSGTLLATLLNFIFPDAIKLFIYVTTLSTVLFLVVWAMIIISYIVFVKRIRRTP